MKRMATLVLALLLLLSMAVPAMAEAPAAKQRTITITTTNSNLPEGHEYTAYQVFKGDLVEKDGKKILTNIEWGAGVDSTKLLDELKKDATLKDAFKNCTTAIDVADAMKSFKDNSSEAKAFAALVAVHLDDTKAKTSTYDMSKKEYKITVDGDGYYFIKDSKETITGNDAIMRYMLQVVDDVTVPVKAVVPSIEKKIVESDNSKVDANNASIGDVVKYELTSKVPDMTHYDQFYFVIHDTLSEGLTFNDDIVVKIGGTMLVKGTDYEVKLNENNETFRIVFKNFVNRNEAVGTAITVTYSATLNEKAVLGSAGNPNTVHLEYSNNPNVQGKGENEPDESQGDNNITGETPKDTVYTYVTGIKLTKTDIDGNILTGAKFKIEGESTNIVLVETATFTEDANGEYYLLKNGTYTKDEPETDTEEQYASTTKKYNMTPKTEQKQTTDTVFAEGIVGDDGVISFEGLGEGTYTITELVAPEGYNLLTKPIEIVITWTAPTDYSTEPKCTWTATKDGTSISFDEAAGVFPITVVNKEGNTLPSTGGIGTTVFYAVGGLLLVGAVIVLITRKRMSAEK